MSQINRFILTLIIAFGAGCTPQSSSQPETVIGLQPCRLYGSSGMTSVAARCGQFTVAENPSDPAGRKIDLFVARVGALNPRFPDTAFTVLAGGPGQAATELYADYASLFRDIHRHHDIVLIDQRGTGQSAMLDCPLEDAADLSFSVALAKSQAQTCLQSLPGDPRFYTTSVAVSDLEQVRAALGYGQLDIYAASYGTRVAQHYLRRFPDRVRTMVIDGVVPPDYLLGPDIALDAQTALMQIFQRCTADPACHDRFGAVDETFNELGQRLRDEPVDLQLPAPTSGELMEFELNYTAFAGAVRLLSYTSETSALLPLLLHEAGRNNNWAPLAAQAQMVSESMTDMLSEGMHNAVMCSEDVPFYNIDADKRATMADTYLGELQIDSLEAICDIWPAGVIDADFHERIESDVPVLLLSGTADPITPPRYAEQAAAQLSNSLHIVAEGHGHGVLTRNCVAGLIAEFVASTNLQGIDASCADRQKATPFFIDFSGPEP